MIDNIPSGKYEKRKLYEFFGNPLK